MQLLTYLLISESTPLAWTPVYQSQRPGLGPRYIRVQARVLDPGISVSTLGAWTPVYQSPRSVPGHRYIRVHVRDMNHGISESTLGAWTRYIDVHAGYLNPGISDTTLVAWTTLYQRPRSVPGTRYIRVNDRGLNPGK